MPRILILTNFFRYGFGGTPESVLLIARGLRGAGVIADVRSRHGLIEDAGSLADLPQTGGGFSVPFAPITAYQGVLIAGAWIRFALPLALAARRAGLPVIYAPKGQLCRIEFERLRDLRKLPYLLMIEQWIARLATGIQFTSSLEQASSLLPARLKTAKSLIIPEPFDQSRFGQAARPARRDGFRLGFLAQISPRKGLRELVEGFLRWSEQNPRRTAELIVAGTALKGSEQYLSAIRTLAAGHPEGRRVQFVGQISGEARTRFYERTDAIAVPSLFESFSLVVPEALWHGVPVLAGLRLGVLEFLHDRPGIERLNDVSPEAIRTGIDRVADPASGLRAAAADQAGRPFALFEPGLIAAALLDRLKGDIHPSVTQPTGS